MKRNGRTLGTILFAATAFGVSAAPAWAADGVTQGTTVVVQPSQPAVVVQPSQPTSVLMQAAPGTSRLVQSGSTVVVPPGSSVVIQSPAGVEPSIEPGSVVLVPRTEAP